MVEDIFLLQHRVFRPFHIAAENTFTINDRAIDPRAEADRYDDIVSKGIAVAILGIGPGGHIGFNESGTPFGFRTHLAALSPETVYRDQVERGQKTPKTALTQGIANILEATEVVLTAYGHEKGKYLQPSLYTDISEKNPASALRFIGDKVSLFIDGDAAQALTSRS